MKLEDYSKYYIQGSDHYLVPKEVFIELFKEMINWKEENEELKKQLKGTTHCYDEVEHRQLKEQQQEFIKYLKQCIENEEYCYMSEKKEDRVRKDIFEEILSKYKEIIGVKND